MNNKGLSDLNPEDSEKPEFIDRDYRRFIEWAQTQVITMSLEEQRKLYLSYPEKVRLEYARKNELKRLNEPDKLEE
jgi:hypothetical protein